MQEDVKKLIAYSSVAHMGFVTMGLFAMTVQGVAGGIFQMISHGIVSAALFLCVGVIYDRMHTREIAAYGGLVNRMPVYAFVFMVFTLANIGLPGTSGFVGEFLTLIGTFRVNNWVATLATIGTILSAAYVLWLYRKVIFGRLEKPSLAAITDVGWREMVDIGAARGPDHRVRRLPAAGARHIGGFGGAADRQFQSCGRQRARRRRWRGEAMNPDLTASALVPLLPELLLGVGAMTLLILGVYRSEEAGRLIDAASVALLVIAGLDRAGAAGGQAGRLRRQFRCRRFRPLPEDAGDRSDRPPPS